MAVTPARVAALALIAAAAAATLLLPPEPHRLERAGTYRRIAAEEAGRALHSARRAITLRVLRDSVRTAARGDDRTVPILFPEAWDPGRRAWLTDRLAELAPAVERRAAAAMVFADDTIFTWSAGLYYALPEGPDEPCAAMYVQNPRHARVSAFYRAAAPALLGPCAYYARFGHPGSAVARWLREGGTALAVTAPGLQPVTMLREQVPRQDLLLALMSGNTSAWTVDERLGFPLTFSACLRGDDANCAAFVLGPRLGDRALARLGIREESRWAAETVAGRFLGDLLGEIGPERFAALWRADGPFEEAFAAVVGTGLGAWTRQWGQRYVGAERARPVVGAGAVGISLGMAVVFLALATLIAARRRVH